MDELDRHAGEQRPLGVVGDEVDQEGPETLAAGADGLGAHALDEARAASDRVCQTRLECVEKTGEILAFAARKR